MASMVAEQVPSEARQSIVDTFDQLPGSEQIEVIADLWNRFSDVEDEFILTAEQQELLDQRIEEIRSGKAVMIPWEDVKAEFETRFARTKSNTGKERNKT